MTELKLWDELGLPERKSVIIFKDDQGRRGWTKMNEKQVVAILGIILPSLIFTEKILGKSLLLSTFGSSCDSARRN